MQASFKTHIVCLILNRQTEEALELLAKHYNVEVPKLAIGLPKGHKNNIYGTYSPKTQTISLLNSEVLGNPFVILHEFYHHLRTKNVDRQHRGTEKNANKFAAEFIKEYQATAKNCDAA
ncbi:MAG: hypothetical protein N3D85_01565 [Candidatus Bathyarchaeota archaeon]|nr:hypothetical protein [Candidatus Bathyarchaeota archaeon]